MRAMKRINWKGLSRKKKIAAGAAAVAALFLVVSVGKAMFGGGNRGGGPGGMPGGMAMMNDTIPTVSVVTPETGSIELSTSLTGEVEPSDVVYVLSLIHIFQG